MILQPAWLAVLIADFHALVAAWGSARGGWRAAWRDGAQLLARREIFVETQAPSSGAAVLRTRLRLNGDAQTDILRSWLEGAADQPVAELSQKHFQSVADAARGSFAMLAMLRLGTSLIVALGGIAGAASGFWALPKAQWESVVSTLLTSWGTLVGLAIAVFGFLLRWALRLWLRWKFRSGLSFG